MTKNTLTWRQRWYYFAWRHAKQLFLIRSLDLDKRNVRNRILRNSERRLASRYQPTTRCGRSSRTFPSQVLGPENENGLVLRMELTYFYISMNCQDVCNIENVKHNFTNIDKKKSAVIKEGAKYAGCYQIKKIASSGQITSFQIDLIFEKSETRFDHVYFEEICRSNFTGILPCQCR